MNTLHIVGGKDHGKTTLILDLLRELTGRGLRVGTIKHTSHRHDLDTPGSDSYQHRQTGAVPAAIVTSELVGVFFPRPVDFYEHLAPLYADCDLVLVEGHMDHVAPKIEIWRRSLGTPCLAADRGDILALVTDDPVEISVPVWPRSDIRSMADRLISLSSSYAAAGLPCVPNRRSATAMTLEIRDPRKG
jgi:molybdopterin-guanine dinucleotide biosynthesis adapter protein